MTTTPEETPKKKKKDRARESQEAPPPPPPAGDPLGMRVIAATAVLVALIGVVVWATRGGSARSGRADEPSDEIRGADEVPAGEADEDRAEARPAKRPPRAEPPAARPGDIPAPPDVAAPPADAQRTPSGLASKILRPGNGDRHPTATSRVTVHYTGWTTDGHMFDSSVTRGEPATFGLDRVIAGWTEGVPLMVTGERRRFWIPEDLAYHGRPGAPAGMLVFDVELISIAD